MLWKPKLIKLTGLPFDGIEDKTIFIDPANVASIVPMNTSYGEEENKKWIVCTMIKFHHSSFNAHCMESPSQVARMCDEAMGHKWGLQTV